MVRRYGGWEQSIKVRDTSGYAWSQEGWLETAGVAGKDPENLQKRKRAGCRDGSSGLTGIGGMAGSDSSR